MKKDNKKNKNRNSKIQKKKKILIEEKMEEINKIDQEKLMKKKKKFALFFMLWICFFAVGLVKKAFQNDTFYTIEIGEVILNNGIDMMDHFSIHADLAYTYPHWLYDVFIYICYLLGGYTGIYISTIALLLIVLGVVFKLNIKITNNYSVSAFATFICTLSLAGFATARAQLASFLIFAVQLYLMESFLQTGKKRNLIGLLILSWLICNIHVAVWPFYYIVFLPYLAEYAISWMSEKIKVRKKNKFANMLKNKFVTEKNNNVKWLFIVMILSLFTGLLTPIGDTPYTYMINMTMSNAQEYVQEHQMLSWINSPFTIIMLIETIVLSIISKIKLRDFFMIFGLAFMSVMAVRHVSLLALIGTICFARLFTMFFSNYGLTIDEKVVNFLSKKWFAIPSFIVVIIGATLLLNYQWSHDFIDKKFYPVAATKYIKENIDISKMRLFNEYNFGSYLLHHDIPVFIDSRADLYTAEFSGMERDIFDDYHYSPGQIELITEYYNLTHFLIYNNEENAICAAMKNAEGFKVIYEDKHFILYEKI